MNKFMLSITASSGEFYQGDCEDLTLPISDGIYGVQAGHNPVLVALHMGILHFVVDGKARDVLVGDGIAEVTQPISTPSALCRVSATRTAGSDFPLPSNSIATPKPEAIRISCRESPSRKGEKRLSGKIPKISSAIPSSP